MLSLGLMIEIIAVIRLSINLMSKIKVIYYHQKKIYNTQRWINNNNEIIYQKAKYIRYNRYMMIIIIVVMVMLRRAVKSRR